MKKCARCGNENADEMRFCLNCGNPLGAAPQTQSFAAQPNFAAPRRSGRTRLIVGAGAALFALALLLLGAGAAVWLVFSGAKNKTAANARTETLAAANSNRAADSNRLDQSSVNAAAESQTTSASGGSTGLTSVDDEPTKAGSFTVAADEGWQLSDIKVVPLEEFLTTVEGDVDLAEIKDAISAKGVTDAKSKARRLDPKFPTGALLMRTKLDAGGYSNVVAVAQNPLGLWKNGKDERGTLEFAINDNQPADNEGEFVVQVVMASAP